jgi:hypothetical protein
LLPRRSLLLQFAQVRFVVGLLDSVLFGQPSQAALQTIGKRVVHGRPGDPNDLIHDADLGTGNDLDRLHGGLAFPIEQLILLQIQVIGIDRGLRPARGVGEHQPGGCHVAGHRLLVKLFDQSLDLLEAQRLRSSALKSGDASGKGIPRSSCIAPSEPTARIAALLFGVGWRFVFVARGCS